MSAPASPAGGMHAPCCSSHGVPMTCARYRRTHFVEVRPCCAVDAAAMKAESEARFEAAVMAGPNLDNVTDPDVIGAYGLEYDGPRCERCEDTPVNDTNVPCADCLTEIGDDHWPCPRCDAHWYRLHQSHEAWVEAIARVQVAHLARHDREDVAGQRCPTCRGAGGWQQHDGLIVECPRGCMTAGAA